MFGTALLLKILEAYFLFSVIGELLDWLVL